MFTNKHRLAVFAAGILALGVAWVVLRPGGPDSPAGHAAAVEERLRSALEMRDGRLHEPGADRPFDGLLVEYHPGQRRKTAIEIREGKPHGLSRGWYANGQIEVREHFVDGVSHGRRTRWYENGKRRSQAEIENGVIVGQFQQWHPNGQKAAEVAMTGGEPDGLSLAWHESGELKSRVVLENGKVIEREDFD